MMDNVRDAQSKGRRLATLEQTRVDIPRGLAERIAARSRASGRRFADEVAALLEQVLADYITISDVSARRVAEQASLSTKWDL
jgi:hypothetical protein